MDPHYIRHELLRHESVRIFSMMKIEIEDKLKIAALGFYADTEIKAFVCFSCQQIVKFVDSKEIHQIHRFITPQCSFLNGRDVSVGYRQWGPDYTYISLLGISQFNNPKWFSRPITESIAKLVLKEFTLAKSSLEARLSPIKSFLGVLHLPMYIPSVNNSNKVLNIEQFFITMRYEERRIQTFQIKNYPFVFSKELAHNLAKNGFFLLF